MKLLISTRNVHKLREIRQIFTLAGVEVVTLDAFPNAPEVEEDADSFDGNASKKASVLAAYTGLWTLADDSGLEVNALGGEPGVYSARYAGEPIDYEANNRKLLAAISVDASRHARFRCVIALAAPDGTVRTVEGRCEGEITFEPSGANGFGYDPVFIPEGEVRTFAEMSDDEKNAISHRGRALQAAQAAWSDLLSTAI